MKNLMLSLLAVVAFAFTANAQDTWVKKDANGKAITKKKATFDHPKEAKKAVFKKDGRNVVLKKDGTPDKRYKANAGKHLKKDGTPDRRYNENKALADKKAKEAKQAKARAILNVK